ncbi:enterochelin esterase domain-containing protein [Stutzerimonas kirkiae]|nr:alpha/beta hydrolase-fold protein [Stutzerimonas kirkiae]
MRHRHHHGRFAGGGKAFARACVLGMALAASHSGMAASAIATLSPGVPVRVAGGDASERSWTLALQAGDFLRGRVIGGIASLDLQDERGRHLRRLVDARELSRDFMLVAPASGTYRLLARDPERAGYTLVTEQILPKTAQRLVPATPRSPLLRQLSDQLASLSGAAAQAALDAFWRDMAVRGTPLVESLSAEACAGTAEGARPCELLVSFLWRGARHGVMLRSSPSGDHDPLRRLGDSDIWYRSYRLPASARLSYQLAPDVPSLPRPALERRRAILATAQRDPLNPMTFPVSGVDRYQRQSVLQLPQAPLQPWLEPRAHSSRGRVEKHLFSSRLLGNTREITLYRPAGWQAEASGRGLLVVFDAHAYDGRVPTPTILDNLRSDGLVPPTAAILIGNPDAAARAAELPPNRLFARFIAEELMPWARNQGIGASAGQSVIAGSSYGGLASAYVALRHPEWFGNVLSQSGSFWWGKADNEAPNGNGAAEEEPQWLTRQYARQDRLPLRFYLEAGLFESKRGQSGSILATTRHLRDVLRAKGYPVTHAEYASGHDYLHWRGSLACGLVVLLGPKPEAMTDAQRGLWDDACPGRP